MIAITLFLLLPRDLGAKESAYPFILDNDSVDVSSMTDSMFYSIAYGVKFPVNKYTLDTKSDFYRTMVDSIIPILKDEKYYIAKVVMRGSASPDGTLSGNTKLGQKRLGSLYKFLEDNLDLPHRASDQMVVEIPEDYAYLALLMKQANDKDYKRVQSLVDKYVPDKLATMKSKLKALDKGKVWARLNKQYFADLRSSRVVFFVSKSQAVMEAFLVEKIVKDTLPYLDSTLTFLPVEADTVAYPVFRNDPPFVAGPDRLPRREWMSVKTNLLYDFAYVPFGYNKFCPIPNIAVEFYPLHGHFTYGFMFESPWQCDFDGNKIFMARNYQVEGRYYVRDGDIDKNLPGHGAAYRGFYLQAYGHLALYSLCMSANKGWMGEGLGLGLGLGYVLPLTKTGHWRLEFNLQAGVFASLYDPYHFEDDHKYYYTTDLGKSDFKARQHLLTWFGPTHAGITLSYDLLYRTGKHKPRLSFSPWEKLKEDK